LKNLIKEIHRRSLWQVVGIYLAGGWVALQVVEQLAEAAGLPEWVRPFALALLVIGFPIVVATAFVQEGLGSKEPGPEPQSLADAGEVSPQPLPVDGAARVFTWRNAVGGGVVALAIWGLVALGWVFLGGSGPAGVAPTTAVANPAEALLPQGGERARSVAVLPFANLSLDEENAFFADGVHESILTQLSKIGELRVLSRASMLRYRDTDLSLREIAEEVGAGAILQGSVQRAGDQLRISAQLTDPLSEENLWAETFDGAVADIFDFQSTVAIAVAGELEATLSPREQVAVNRPSTESVTANDFYLQGRIAYDLFTREGNEEAIRLFRLAIAEDSSFAEAWAGLGDGYLQGVQWHGYPNEWVDSAMVAAEIAVTFDEDLADAHKTLGFALSFTGREEAALTEYERAVELNPNHNAAVNNIGVIHAGVGRHAEALRWYKRAFPLDPNNVLSRLNVGFAYAALGEYDIARTWFDQAARLTPGDPSVALYNWFVDVMDGGAEQANRRLQTAIQRMNEIEPRILGALAEGAFYAGDAQSALRYSDEALEGVPEGGTLNGFGDLRVAKAWGLTREGMTGEALEILNRVGEAARALLDEGSEAWGTLYIAAQVEALRGSREDALALLVRSLEHGLPYQALDQDPIFDDYRGDSRYVSARRRAEERVGLMRAEIAAEERAAGERP
jgi:TolB-like protein/Tfp pilus assembly protein PilF